eukprot:TRINITY_DN35957_c0_g1_i1.p1 TRINITY_DN35957_c0_g1~~TRINITY_DN35957_c0_g1_i1.p1  ORF type:complete len:506 (+),score=75.84 TRINITY_DN35957_c0_g1_i1:82-1599(+)
MLVRERSKVAIHGLDSSVNGKVGTCQAWFPDQQRWQVLLDDGNMMYAKVDNLFPQVRPGGDQAGASVWICAICSFKNNARNTRCGGAGGLGCKAAKTAVVGDSLPVQPATVWICPCGFKNSAQNAVCGGAGPMGCKVPRIPGTSTLTGPAAFWVCKQCGFNNSARNTRCGGNGSMGCKAERTTAAQVELPLLGRWRCICGFMNSALNAKCGGTGPKGCKAERIPMKPPTVAATLSAQSTTLWTCMRCGFKNSAVNTQCGGTGPLGCKAERDQAAEALSVPLGPPPASQKQGRYDGWTCECGYVNSCDDAVCGASGNAYLGCKSKRRSAPSAAICKSNASPPAPSAVTATSHVSGNRKRRRPALDDCEQRLPVDFSSRSDEKDVSSGHVKRERANRRATQPLASTKKRRRLGFPFQNDAIEDAAELESWLLDLDFGKGSMLRYLEPLKEEFGDLIQLAAAAQPYELGTSIVNAVAQEVYDSLGMHSLGHKLLLARAIVTLAERGPS